MASEQTTPDSVLDSRIAMTKVHRAILNLLRGKKGLSGAEIIATITDAGLPMSQPTFSRKIGELIAAGYVYRQGAGRQTRYCRDELRILLGVDPMRRPKVSYSFDRLTDYIPNQTQWLTRQETETMLSHGRHDHRLDASTYSRAIMQRLMIELSFASSKLENNNYSILDTKALIEFGQAAEGVSLEETQMILNHKDAILHLIDNVDTIDISAKTVKSIQAHLSKNLLQDDRGVGGIRQTPVQITGTAYIPLAVPSDLENELLRICGKAAAIENPFEQSLFLLAFISYLQAFVDVNKRTARLSANIPLLKNGLCPLSFLSVNKSDYLIGTIAFYELGRVDYLKRTVIDAYKVSADHYIAYTSGTVRTGSSVELERRGEIAAAIREFVQAVAAGDDDTLPDVKSAARAFAISRFSSDPESVQKVLADRIADTCATIHENNFEIWGITAEQFDRFSQRRVLPDDVSLSATIPVAVSPQNEAATVLGHEEVPPAAVPVRPISLADDFTPDLG